MQHWVKQRDCLHYNFSCFTHTFPSPVWKFENLSLTFWILKIKNSLRGKTEFYSPIWWWCLTTYLGRWVPSSICWINELISIKSCCASKRTKLYGGNVFLSVHLFEVEHWSAYFFLGLSGQFLFHPIFRKREGEWQ